MPLPPGSIGSFSATRQGNRRKIKDGKGKNKEKGRKWKGKGREEDVIY